MLRIHGRAYPFRLFDRFARAGRVHTGTLQYRRMNDIGTIQVSQRNLLEIPPPREIRDRFREGRLRQARNRRSRRAGLGTRCQMGHSQLIASQFIVLLA